MRISDWSSDVCSSDLALVATRLTELVDRPVDELSGGQRQRVWIALTLAQGTPLMLLDEPTTFLDLAHQVEVLDMLAELNDSKDRTIVIVQHDLNLAHLYADKLITICDGGIADDDHPSQINPQELVERVIDLEPPMR